MILLRDCSKKIIMSLWSKKKIIGKQDISKAYSSSSSLNMFLEAMPSLIVFTSKDGK